MITETIFNQLEFYSDRAAYFQKKDDTEMSAFFVQQGRDLIAGYEQELMVIDSEKL